MPYFLLFLFMTFFRVSIFGVFVFCFEISLKKEKLKTLKDVNCMHKSLEAFLGPKLSGCAFCVQ